MGGGDRWADGHRLRLSTGPFGASMSPRSASHRPRLVGMGDVDIFIVKQKYHDYHNY